MAHRLDSGDRVHEGPLLNGGVCWLSQTLNARVRSMTWCQNSDLNS